MVRLPLAPQGPLPPLYSAWVGELLEGPIPPETEATCDDCAMCADVGDSSPRAGSAAPRAFDPRVKCCTYQPALPNFLVGRILEDDDPRARDGRASVEARIDQRIAVTPLGLSIPAPYTLLYRHNRDHGGFGKATELRCPHYLESAGGSCGIWKNRNSVCTTWFCKHTRGATGSDFWTTGILPLLQEVEAELSWHCVLTLAPDAAVLRRLFAVERGLDGPTKERGAELAYDPSLYDRDWGSWVGRERELFRACASLVAGFLWEDVFRIGGPALRARAHVARAAYASLRSRALPKRLRVGPITVVAGGPEGGDEDAVRIVTYSPNDPIDVPKLLLPLLRHFNGRRTADVVREIAEREGVTLDRSLLRKLVDFGVLLDAERDSVPAP